MTLLQDTTAIATQSADTTSQQAVAIRADRPDADTTYLHRLDTLALDTLTLDSLTLDSLRLDSIYRDSLYQDSMMRVRLQAEADSIAALPKGMAGTELPFSLHRSDAVMGASLLSIMLLLFVLGKTRNNLTKRISAFFYPKNLSADDNLTHQDHPLVIPSLMLVFSIECSILFMGYANAVQMFPQELLAQPRTLGCYVLATLLFLVLKVGLYSFVNSVFFSRNARRFWRMHYSLLFLFGTFMLLPLTLLYVFSGIDSEYVYYAIALLLLFVNILVIVKGFSSFFRKIAGSLHLFVYFCALEAAPAVFWWVALTWLTTFLI